MENLKKGSLSSSRMSKLAVIGSVASIAGFIVTVVFRIHDRRNHETKESNRPAKE